jgi:hypothetical protein
VSSIIFYWVASIDIYLALGKEMGEVGLLAFNCCYRSLPIIINQVNTNY